jgi:hypothetical protein
MERQDHFLYPLVREPSSRWEKTGITPAQERTMNIMFLVLVVLFVSGWTYTAVEAVRRGEASTGFASRVTANPLGPTAPPEAAFLLDAALRRLVDHTEYRGLSGQLRFRLVEPGDEDPLPQIPGVDIVYEPAAGTPPEDLAPQDTTRVPSRPGVWNIAIRARGAVRQVPDLHVITLRPVAEARSGRLGPYQIGQWPRPTGPQAAAYAAPRGLIEVTPQNVDLQISRHFRIRDFLTKGQENVWPKYVYINPRLVDKLELTIDELERMGHPVENVFVISGFRHPQYNVHGGDPRGRGALSRHMYGDAADFAIDNNRNSCMDDLNGDGRVDVADARIVVRAAEAVERRHPHLIGGIGIYRPVRGSHCGMVHIDTRGWRARW